MHISRNTIEPHVVVLGSRYDLSCDYVIAHLHESEVPYLRLNSEDLPSFKLEWDPVTRALYGQRDNLNFRICNDHLSGIFFRRPTFHRQNPERPPEEGLSKLHWAAFLRNFMMFCECQWINHPASTYLAEHKAYQLSVASNLGFKVPWTRVGNSFDISIREDSNEPNPPKLLALKGLDTILWRQGHTEHFGYTSFLSPEQLQRYDLSTLPTIIQEALSDKLDIRVTVAGSRLWASSITTGGESITGDWRLAKDNADFKAYQLPDRIQNLCIRLVHEMDLTFGAIDLALQGEEFYFLEINPIGEWVWLEERLNFDIAKSLAEKLTGHPRC